MNILNVPTFMFKVNQKTSSNVFLSRFQKPYHFYPPRFSELNCVQPRMFNIERTTIFIFSFCIELVTLTCNSALRVLKHYYITERIRELLIAISRLLIQNLLNQLICYTDIKESCFFVTEIVETLGLNI